MKKVIWIISFIVLFAAFSVVKATPSTDASSKKTYYTTPIREFRGATFYQWKKFTSARKASSTKDSVREESIASEKATPKTISTSAKRD